MKTFYKLLVVTLVAVTTNNFVWFALTYWAYLNTKSVISTSILAGVWLTISIFTANWFGSLIDHHRKKTILAGSGIVTFILFSAGLIIFLTSPANSFSTVASAWFWLFILIVLLGVVAGSIYNIAIPTLVAFLVPEDKHDRANGLFGTVIGASFAITSVASGIAIAFSNMSFILLCGLVANIISIISLLLINIPEAKIIHNPGVRKNIDPKGTFKIVKAIPGLMSLIFFSTFNNFLGGVFFALMDAYGLSLMSVQTWGILWGFLSLGFILGGLYIAKKGLGSIPLRTLFRANIATWTVCIFFAVQPSILLLAIGIFVWIFLSPFIEAIEQTIFQKVVSKERLGRVFGFAHSIEQAASPITAFFIGPIAQFFFIPFMTTGKGAELIGSWFGTGPGRGIALVFMLSGIIGLTVALIAMHSRFYKLLSDEYKK